MASGRIWNALRLRSSQGLSVNPQKPVFGEVIWKVKFDSGISFTVRYTSRAEGASWSSVEFDGVWTAMSNVSASVVCTSRMPSRM